MAYDHMTAWETAKAYAVRAAAVGRYYAMEAQNRFVKTLNSPAGRWALTAVVVGPAFLGAASKASAAISELSQASHSSGLLEGLSGQAKNMLNQGVTIPQQAAAQGMEWAPEVSRVCTVPPQDVQQSVREAVDLQRQGAFHAEAIANGEPLQNLYGQRADIVRDLNNQIMVPRPNALPPVASPSMVYTGSNVDRTAIVSDFADYVREKQNYIDGIDRQYPGASLLTKCVGPER